MVARQVDEELVYLLDRSAGERDDTCGMSFWWERLEGNRGIVPIEKSHYLTEGIQVHEDIEILSGMELTDASIQRALDTITARMGADADREVLYRRLGWMAANALYVEPLVRKEFENVSVEGELILDRSPLWVPVTPDRVLKHRQDGYLVYREGKSTITAGLKWITSWPYAIQLHLGLKAIEEEAGLKVAYAQIVGFMKGDRRGERLSHPYVWGWRNSSTGQWTHDYNKARTAAWEPAPVWEYPGGVLEWVKLAGPEVGVSQFPHSTPVFLNERLLNTWINRKTARMEEVAHALDMSRIDPAIRELYFEPRTKNCRPAFGDPCPYLAACHNASIGAAPLASGLYEERTPHHTVEIQFLKGQGRI